MSEKDFNAVFSKQLRYYLNKHDMTQLELAKRLGVGTTSVYNWCNGIKTPRMDKVDAMCSIFGCRRSDLILETPAPENPSLVFSDKEIITIKKYRTLDEYGKKNVDTILDNEYTRCNPKPADIESSSVPTSDDSAPIRFSDSYIPRDFDGLAAHAIPGASQEDIEDDIRRIMEDAAKDRLHQKE